jgi:predicted ester cyclase
VFSDVAAPADQVGKKAVEKSYKEMFKGFSDLKLEVTRTWAAGDYLVSEGSFVGTNDGAMPSMGVNKPTGKKVSSRYLEIDKIVNGKVKNMWVFDNGMAFAMQLGLMPPPGAKPAGAAAAQAGTPGAKPGSAAAAPSAKPAAAAAAPAKTAAPAPAAGAPAMKPATPAPTAPAAPPKK